VIVIIPAAFSGCIMSRVAEPKFSVVATQGDIEIRAYPSAIVAEVEVAGERKQAINEGFRLIAGYIFGGNTPRQKISMTAPVTQQRGEKIAMTAPVTQQGKGDVWKVRFVMPEGYTLETLPRPNDERVKLIAVPSKRFVVIRFSGSQGDKNMKPHQEKLLEYVRDHKLLTTGEPILAFYNPPWTLPFLKRNEVMVELLSDLGTSAP
jgi:effector-binding domain-containing protein